MGRKKFDKLNERQRRFAEYVVTGRTLIDSYVKAGYNGDRKRKYISTCAGILLRNPLVIAYMEELRKPRKAAAVLELHEKREYLARVVRSSPTEVSVDSDLCQSIRSFKSGTVNVIMPSKLRAIEIDARLAGEISTRKKEEVPEAYKNIFANMPEEYPLPCEDGHHLEVE